MLVRQGLILAGLGVAVWAAPTLFFLLFGDWVLLETGDPYFGSSLFLLEMLTLLLLIGLALIVRLRLLPARGSAARFGFATATIGLLLGTFAIWRRDAVFPSFTEGQHHAYAVWMTLAYALTLIVPAVVDLLVKEKPKTAEQAAEPDSEAQLEDQRENSDSAGKADEA